MSRSLVALVGLIAVMPLAVEVPTPADSVPHIPGATRVEVAGGYAYYTFVSRGCEGDIISHVPAHATDGAVSVDHRFEGTPLRVGIRGGWVRDRIGSNASGAVYAVPPEGTYDNRYVNPNLELDDDHYSFGVGWVGHQREFMTAGEGAREQEIHDLNDVSGHVRLGSEQKYFLVSWMEGMPVSTDGGYLAIGVGGRLPAAGVSSFLGMGAGGPIEGAGPMFRTNVEVARDWRLEFKLRGGYSGSLLTGSAALGVQYQHVRREDEK